MGRQLSIGYAYYGLIAGVLGLILNIFVVFPAMMPDLNQAGPEQAAAIGGMLGGIVAVSLASLIRLCYCTLCTGLTLFRIIGPHEPRKANLLRKKGQQKPGLVLILRA